VLWSIGITDTSSLGRYLTGLLPLKQIVFWREYAAAERRQMGGAMLHPLLFMPLAVTGQGHSSFLRACITEDALPRAAYPIKRQRLIG